MIYIAALFLLMACVSLRGLIKHGPKRDRVIVLAAYAVVFIVCMILAGGIEIPSPLTAVGNLLKAIGLSYPPLK